MYQRIRELWLSITLKQKFGLYIAMVILIMALSGAFSIRVMNFSLGSFYDILDGNSRCYDFQEAMDLEVRAFENYIRERTEELREVYVLACVRTERCLRSLPYDYEVIGEERYARTWNVRNGYQNYSIYRDKLANGDNNEPGFIAALYQVYDMQSYLQTYARRLVQVTLTAGNRNYQEQVPMFRRIPYMIIVFSVVMTAAAIWLTKVLSGTLLEPVIRLAQSSRKIAQNDFSVEDFTIPNRDEMGELVTAYHKMKHATEGYINTLMKNHEMSELLHREEMERVEMEKRLDSAQLELLKSQINPHFLFNTLNMIGCMAKLEDAGTTERMITSMSNLFRYNLKTSEQFVPLEQELKVVQDYVYIQQMRFGSRIQYDSDIQVDAGKVIIPAFTLQPVVENAIIHGLSKKEQGGRLHLRIWNQESRVIISVADTGLGMKEKERERLEDALRDRKTGHVGIGLGNIYKRIHIMYDDGDMRIYSRAGCGTVVQMMIPQETITENDGITEMERLHREGTGQNR